MPRESIASVYKLTNMANSHICSCFGGLRPRYKRLVDNIFPPDPRSGLVKANMDKLIFYALSSPEKLDRIGDYLARKLSRHVDRRRHAFVVIAMEALDQLLLACHAPNLNLFVESFLRIVQKLLESTETDLQVLGTASFVKFANIEEDTPSYHRRYDFFVSKFSSMCWNSSDNEKEQVKVRMAGLRGLQGVVRKTVSDDLQVNIWDKSHMGKIIPSLLFNMEAGQNKSNQATEHATNENGGPKEDPSALAESCLRELISKASFGNIKAVVNPALTHMDTSALWDCNDFAVKVFKIVMFSLQNQYSYVAIQMLLNHLDTHTKESPRIKSGIVRVLATAVSIASRSSIGPAVLEVFNTLLRHLRLSVDARLDAKENKDSDAADDEREYEESLVNTVGVFAQVLPDFQKTDIMMFILAKFPLPSMEAQSSNSSERTRRESHPLNDPLSVGNSVLQKMLLGCLQKVAQSFNASSMASTFSPSFLETLLKATITRDPTVRNLAQEIFYTLIDRHGNHTKLGVGGVLKSGQDIDLTVEKASKHDLFFFKKHRDEIFWYLYESASDKSNSVENYVSIYLTLAVLATELSEIEVLSCLVQFTFGLQNMATREELHLPNSSRCALHSVTGAFLHLAAELSRLHELKSVVTRVTQLRQKEASYLMPENALRQPVTSPHCNDLPKHLLFDFDHVCDALKKAGGDEKFFKSPYEHQALAEVMSRTVSPDTALTMHSEFDGHTTPSPGLHPHILREHITFQMLKNIVSDKPVNLERQNNSDVHFTKSTLEELADLANIRAQEFNSHIMNALDVCETPFSTRSISVSTLSISSVPGDDNYEIKFPEQYVY